jgi:hypothetical protein
MTMLLINILLSKLESINMDLAIIYRGIKWLITILMTLIDCCHVQKRCLKVSDNMRQQMMDEPTTTTTPTWWTNQDGNTYGQPNDVLLMKGNINICTVPDVTSYQLNVYGRLKDGKPKCNCSVL